ncbi:30S ribosomal protein S18, partial [Salmonella enterica]|uniref:30S ribosomal protein S18 n=1 Tax=Salmonella enterica TaxID=28901 RepID=UPI00398C3B50
MARYFRRRQFYRFTAEGVQGTVYKYIATMKNFITKSHQYGPCLLTGPLANIPQSASRRTERPP